MKRIINLVLMFLIVNCFIIQSIGTFHLNLDKNSGLLIDNPSKSIFTFKVGTYQFHSYSQQENYIVEIPAYTTIEKFKSNVMSSKVVVEEYEEDDENKEYIKTGDKVKIGGNSYIAIVLGDLDRDGKCTYKDILIEYSHYSVRLLEKLSGIDLAAADLDHNGKVEKKDVDLIAKQEFPDRPKDGEINSNSSRTMNSGSTIVGSQSEWLEAVKHIADEMVADGNWTYSNSNNKTNYTDARNASSRVTNCALFVGHCLQYFGALSSKQRFYGHNSGVIKYIGKGTEKKLREVADIYDYAQGEKYVYTADLQPGDILTYYGQHTNIYVGKNSSGQMLWYDAGRWSGLQRADGTFQSFSLISNNIGNMSISHIIRLRYNTGSTSEDFVQYYQDDYSNVPYGSGSIATCGCGPTAFAMVATALTGTTITPKDAIEWCGNTYYVNKEGTSWAYFAAATNHFNLNCTLRETTDINAVLEALRDGKYVISSQGPGDFTTQGHFILLSGIDSSNKITVKDPNKKNAVNQGYNNMTFDVSNINKTSLSYWIFD